jgi:recombination protein RecA
LVQKSGAFYSYGESRLGQGRENAKDYLVEHKDVAQEIEQQIRSVVFTSRSPDNSDLAAS